MSERTTTTRDNDASTYVAAITALIGAWILVSAFVYDPPPVNFWNDVIVGAAIAVIAGYNAMKADDVEGVNTGAASMVALLGLWVMIAPFIFEVFTDGAFWNDVVSGLLVAVLAGYNAYQSRETERPARTAEPETR